MSKHLSRVLPPMAMNTGWPPQAYTKETLAEAFEWLKSQPDNVRALAKDSSTLVSLYRNFQMRNRDGFTSSLAEEVLNPQNSAAKAPVSGEVFKAELKNLAQGLEEFSPSPTVNSISKRTSTQPMNTAPSPQHSDIDFSETKTGNPTLPPHVTRHRWEEPQAHEGSGSEVAASKGAESTRPTSARGLAALLDATSQQRINQVQTAMNLSSDAEALRMLISLGFDRLKGILPVD